MLLTAATSEAESARATVQAGLTGGDLQHGY
jgi:hypothetical protein